MSRKKLKYMNPRTYLKPHEMRHKYNYLSQPQHKNAIEGSSLKPYLVHGVDNGVSDGSPLTEANDDKLHLLNELPIYMDKKNLE